MRHALPAARLRVKETLRWVRGPVGRWRERREVLRTFVSYAHCLAESLADETVDVKELQAA